MRVLAVGAHPDDVELLCMGTLARYVALGHQVVIAHACTGDKGHQEIPHTELAQIRGREAQAAAAVIGAGSMSIGFPDGELYRNAESVKRFVDAIRSAKPDLIITHHPDDYHGDHRAVSNIIADASFLATLPYYETNQPAHAVTCPVYYMDTVAGVGFNPTDYVDITETIELKRQAMSQHASQFNWLREHHSSEALALIDIVARFRGVQCGVEFAEGFRRMEAWGRLTASRLLP